MAAIDDLLSKPVIAVDFDWVLHAGSGFVPEGGSIVADAPVNGAIAWLYEITEAFQVVVFSVSADTDENRMRIVSWLTANGLINVPYVVTNVKPDALTYIDDRGWRFDGPGTFPSTTDLLGFRPWWKHGEDTPPQDATPDELALALAAMATKEEPSTTANIQQIALQTGATVVGADQRLKDVKVIASKISDMSDLRNQSPLIAAKNLHDALRYSLVYPEDTYMQGVDDAIEQLGDNGHYITRLRNYWAPVSPPGTRQAYKTYYGVNAVVMSPSSYQYEVQFHTPESWRVNDEENWPLYAQLRDGNLSTAQVVKTHEQMRANLEHVKVPAGAAAASMPRILPRPRPVIPPLALHAAAMQRVAPPDIQEHNRITAAAAHRAFNEVEPRLAKLIEPVLRNAGRKAATMFRRHATRRLVAAAYRQQDMLRLAALPPVAAQQMVRSLVLTAAGVPGLSSNSTMVAVKPTSEQAKLLAIGDQDPDLLHVTLCYLGDYTGDLNQIAEVLGPVAADHAPLVGEVAGDGMFGRTVGILLPDVPGLVELRVAVAEALQQADVQYGREHGFLPHMTVNYLPGEIPADENYRLARAQDNRVGQACRNCAYFEARGWCQMFGAAAEADMVCNDWTDTPPPDVPVGTPIDFGEILIVRGNNEAISLPLVGAPPLTAAGRKLLGAQSAQTEQALATLLAEVTLLVEQAHSVARTLTDSTARADLNQGIKNVNTITRLAEVARREGDPEKIYTAMKQLRAAEADLRALLTANEPPSFPGAPPSTLPPAPPPAGPTVPGTVKKKLLEQAPSKRLPTSGDVATQVQSDKVTDLLSPELDTRSTDSTRLAGENLTKLLEQEAFLAGPPEATIETIEATPPDWNIPAGDELLNVPDLMSQVRGVTDPVRQAVVQSVATPILDNVGLAFDGTNPFVAKVLAQTASQVTSIAETTQANLMDIIKTSYEQGLSIPDTAKLIQQGMTDASPARATLIARTELAGAVNGGSLAATQVVQASTGVKYVKTWRTAPGARYPRHENYPDLDGQIASDLDGYFTVGDAQLRYPGDPDGPPGEVCDCRCTLTYEEAAGAGVGGVDSGAPAANPQETEPLLTSTSDPNVAAKLLADGNNVILNQPDEISTFIDDLGKQAADAQAAGTAAPNLDLGKVSVGGTNLFTLDGPGIPRVDMPQLSGTPIPGSLASKLPGGYEGQADQVDIGPLFYQHLRDQGISVTEDNVLASHLRSTQKDINGVKVAKLMDSLESGAATERRIPISADNYILDGHHQWAATIGMDYKNGIDQGLTIPVERINQPITKILAEANAFDEHYGIPHVSAFVPPVKDAGTARVLARTVPTPKDPVVGITPFREGVDNPLGFYSSAKAKQFEADLQSTAEKYGVKITSSDHATGVWDGGSEPSYQLHAFDGPTGQASIEHFASDMRAAYNQDSVGYFTPQTDLPTGVEGHDFSYTVNGINPSVAVTKLGDYGIEGATATNDSLTIWGSRADGQKVASLARDFGGDVTAKPGQITWVNRPAEADDYHGLHTAPTPESGAPMSDLTNEARAIYPSDFYNTRTQARYYGTGDRALDEPVFRLVNEVRNKPDMQVTIYRAVPKDVTLINDGDWVTPNRAYAEMHARSQEHQPGAWHVISRQARAGDLYTQADSIQEWGWHPSAPG